MNKINVDVKTVSENVIEYDCTVSGEWEKCFTGDTFRAEYDVDISNVPKSVLMVPIFGSILPISWLFDGEIICDEIDEDFYNSIPQIKKVLPTCIRR